MGAVGTCLSRNQFFRRQVGGATSLCFLSGLKSRELAETPTVFIVVQSCFPRRGRNTLDGRGLFATCIFYFFLFFFIFKFTLLLYLRCAAFRHLRSHAPTARVHTIVEVWNVNLNEVKCVEVHFKEFSVH